MIPKRTQFKDIPLELPDVYRGLYYIDILETESENLISFLDAGLIEANSVETLLKPFFSSLCDGVDRMLLPVISHEIAIASKQGMLNGKDGRSRYENFFIEGSQYSLASRRVLERYQPLFRMIDLVIENTLKSALECVMHLTRDLALLKENRFVEEEDCLVCLDILGKSDPHLGQRTFLLDFGSGKRLIHKSVDLTADQLYNEFLQKLMLPAPFDLKNMRVIPVGHTYGWIEYHPYQECSDLQQIRNFYHRAGALLAVADCLNYSDGHFGNLLAFGEYPILLDGETFFQNYAIRDRKENEKKNLLATSLVQKPPSREVEIGYAAAFQAPPTNHFEVTFPFVSNDQTDDIELHYRGFNDEQSHHCPKMEGRYFTVHGYVKELIRGYSFAFDHIGRHVVTLLADISWWDRVAKVRSRTVLRETMAYCYLMQRIKRPEVCISEIKMKDILKDKLGETPYTAYEIRDLMTANIPYFYHYPGKRHLYQGDGVRHCNLFVNSGVQVLREQFSNWNEEYKSYAIAILENHLPSTPIPGELTYSF